MYYNTISDFIVSVMQEKQSVEELNNFTDEKECSVPNNEKMDVEIKTVQTLHNSSSLEYSELNEEPLTFSG